MSLRRSLRSLIRAGRSGRKHKGGVAKTVAKTAAKWAVKQGVKRGVQTLAAAIASNPIGWAIGVAVVVVAGVSLAAVVMVASISPVGELAEGGLGPGPNQSMAGSSVSGVGTGAMGTGGAGLDPNSSEAKFLCGGGCSPVLTGEGGERNEEVLQFWRRGAAGMPALNGATLFCPLYPNVILKGTGAGYTREAWGNPRAGGVRFHAGLDIYKTTPEAKVIAVHDGVAFRAGSANAFWLTSDINDQRVMFYYTHIDAPNPKAPGIADTRPRNNTRWKRGDIFNNYKRAPGENTERTTARPSDTTISTSESGGVGTPPHIHLGVAHNQTNGPSPQGVGHWNPYPAFKGPCQLSNSEWA